MKRRMHPSFLHLPHLQLKLEMRYPYSLPSRISLILLLTAIHIRAQVDASGPQYSISTLAGSATLRGAVDGPGATARFTNLMGVAIDSEGNIFVTDLYNHTIRKISPQGVVTTFAGQSGSPGVVDGPSSVARFNYPVGLAIDSQNTLYVGDSNNRAIRKISPNGSVTTLAGYPGVAGYQDGVGANARFAGWPDNNFPKMGLATDRSLNVYVADTGNHVIRKISATGVVSTLAGSAGQTGATDGAASSARFNFPSGVAVDGDGNVIVADLNNSSIRKITPTGVVTTIAGGVAVGSRDGTVSLARFNRPIGVVVHPSKDIYITEYGNSTIRRISPSGNVFTVAGLAEARGSTDGVGTISRFASPYAIAFDPSGNMAIADSDNFVVRKGTQIPLAPILNSSSTQATALGQSSTFSVAAEGSNLTYQWFRGSSGITTTPISGANSSSYTTPFVVESTDYWVRVSNPTGSTNSRTFTAQPPSITSNTPTSPATGSGRGLVNMSIRVETTGSPIIPGLVVDTPTKVLIRVAGPSLTQFGVQRVLSNPKITVYSAGRPIGENDDWESNRAAVIDASSRAGAFPFLSGSKDAALVVDLPAGAYTCVVTGDPGSTGEVILEVYKVP